MKNYLKLFTFLALFVLLANCEKETTEPIIQKQNEFIIKNINKSQVQTNIKVSEILEKIEPKKSSNSTQSIVKKSNKNKHGFTVDTTHIKYIEKGVNHSYTFSIQYDNLENDKVTNLLLNLNKKGEYDSYIVKYDFTQEEMENMTFEDFTSSKVKYKSIDFDYSGILVNKKVSEQICLDEQVRVAVPCCDGELCYGSSSDCIQNGGTGVSYEWVTVSSECIDVGGGNNGTDPKNYDSEGGTTSGGGDGSIVTAPNTVPYTSILKNFTSGTLNSLERTYYNRNSNIKNTIDTYLIPRNFSNDAKSDSKSALKLGQSLGLNYEQFNWIFNNRNSEELTEIKGFLDENTINNQTAEEVKAEAKLSIEVFSQQNKFDYSKKGTIRNRPSLRYKAKASISGGTSYLLETGEQLFESSTVRVINKGDALFQTSEDNGPYYYLYTPNDDRWSEFIIDKSKPDCLTCDIKLFFDKLVYNPIKLTGRYVTPVEDIIVLVEGKDFDNVQQSRYKAAGLIVLGFVPGGKLMKPVSKLAKGTYRTAKVVVKNGAEVVVKNFDDLVGLTEIVAKLNSKAKFVLNGTGKYSQVGGHHPLAKIAFDGDALYDTQKAFSVSKEALGGQAIHSKITGQQNSLYSAFAKTGDRLTLQKMAEIEIKAMVNSGIPEDVATGWVIKAMEDLNNQGVKYITKIPWNGAN